jgi:hypothetical protein
MLMFGMINVCKSYCKLFLKKSLILVQTTKFLKYFNEFNTILSNCGS